MKRSFIFCLEAGNGFDDRPGLLLSRTDGSKSIGQRAVGVGRGWYWKKPPRERKLDREV